MLLRLAYLGVSNAFAMLRLLPMTDRDKDAEIPGLCRQITVLERQLGKDKVRFTPSDQLPWRRCCTGCHCTSCEGYGRSYAHVRPRTPTYAHVRPRTPTYAHVRPRTPT
ncbi:hypothetical protein ACFYOY_46875 [Streptomyces sp. NPDC007875]